MDVADSRLNRRKMLGTMAAVGAAALLPSAAWAVEPTDVVEIVETSWEVRPGLVVRMKTYGGIVPGRVAR
jgi:hypothetical protein